MVSLEDCIVLYEEADEPTYTKSYLNKIANDIISKLPPEIKKEAVICDDEFDLFCSGEEKSILLLSIDFRPITRDMDETIKYSNEFFKACKQVDSEYDDIKLDYDGGAHEVDVCINAKGYKSTFNIEDTPKKEKGLKGFISKVKSIFTKEDCEMDRIEECIVLYEATGDEYYLDEAEDILDELESKELIKEHYELIVLDEDKSDIELNTALRQYHNNNINKRDRSQRNKASDSIYTHTQIAKSKRVADKYNKNFTDFINSQLKRKKENRLARQREAGVKGNSNDRKRLRRESDQHRKEISQIEKEARDRRKQEANQILSSDKRLQKISDKKDKLANEIQDAYNSGNEKKVERLKNRKKKLKEKELKRKRKVLSK